jgi:hypothetical protein
MNELMWHHSFSFVTKYFTLPFNKSVNVSAMLKPQLHEIGGSSGMAVHT